MILNCSLIGTMNLMATALTLRLASPSCAQVSIAIALSCLPIVAGLRQHYTQLRDLRRRSVSELLAAKGVKRREYADSRHSVNQTWRGSSPDDKSSYLVDESGGYGHSDSIMHGHLMGVEV
jgi:hypothetical protein